MIELFPTKEQSEYLLQAVGSRRFAYNHLVAYYREHKQHQRVYTYNSWVGDRFRRQLKQL